MLNSNPNKIKFRFENYPKDHLTQTKTRLKPTVLCLSSSSPLRQREQLIQSSTSFCLVRCQFNNPALASRSSLCLILYAFTVRNCFSESSRGSVCFLLIPDLDYHTKKKFVNFACFKVYMTYEF